MMDGIKNIIRNLLFFVLWIGLFISPNIAAETVIAVGAVIAADADIVIKKNQKQIFNIRSAVLYAINHSPSLNAGRRTLDISELDLKNSRFLIFPTIDISSAHQLHHGVPDAPDPNKTSTLSLNATENLYNNGRDLKNIRKKRLEYKIALLQYNKTRDLLTRDVITDFLDLSLQKKLYAIQKANLKIYQEQYSFALRKYKHGLKTQKDVLRLYNQKRRAEIDILQFDNQVTVAKNTLLTELGIESTDDLVKKIDFKTLHLRRLDTKKLPTTTPLLKQQYEYRDFIFQEKITDLNVALAKRDFLPQVSLTASAGVNPGTKDGLLGSFHNVRDERQQLDMSVKLELTYRLLDWGTDRRNILIAQAESRRTLDNIRQQLLGVQRDLSNLMLNLKQNKLSYQISSELKSSEQKSYDAVEQLYRNGNASYLDLINAINDLSTVRTQHITDRYTLEKDLYRYYYYQGTVYEKISG